MAWLPSTNFDTVLRLGEGWGLGRRRADRSWTPLHLHEDDTYGWMMPLSRECSVCEEVFPDKVVGMWNMMEALD